MTLYSTTFETPFGLFSVAVDETKAVVATAFGNVNALRRRLRSIGADSQPTLVNDEARTAEAKDQLLGYFAGKRRRLTLRVNPQGSAFQRRVWHTLTAIPRGTTRSYGDIARELRTAPRAVGRANATNPVCVVIPCHRVIGADGSLTGFAFGEALKERLLALERA